MARPRRGGRQSPSLTADDEAWLLRPLAGEADQEFIEALNRCPNPLAARRILQWTRILRRQDAPARAIRRGARRWLEERRRVPRDLRRLPLLEFSSRTSGTERDTRRTRGLKIGVSDGCVQRKSAQAITGSSF
jgi:hypothetical protein